MNRKFQKYNEKKTIVPTAKKPKFFETHPQKFKKRKNQKYLERGNIPNNITEYLAGAQEYLHGPKVDIQQENIGEKIKDLSTNIGLLHKKNESIKDYLNTVGDVFIDHKQEIKDSFSDMSYDNKKNTKKIINSMIGLINEFTDMDKSAFKKKTTIIGEEGKYDFERKGPDYIEDNEGDEIDGDVFYDIKPKTHTTIPKDDPIYKGHIEKKQNIIIPRYESTQSYEDIENKLLEKYKNPALKNIILDNSAEFNKLQDIKKIEDTIIQNKRKRLLKKSFSKLKKVQEKNKKKDIEKKQQEEKTERLKTGHKIIDNENKEKIKKELQNKIKKKDTKNEGYRIQYQGVDGPEAINISGSYTLAYNELKKRYDEGNIILRTILKDGRQYTIKRGIIQPPANIPEENKKKYDIGMNLKGHDKIAVINSLNNLVENISKDHNKPIYTVTYESYDPVSNTYIKKTIKDSKAKNLKEILRKEYEAGKIQANTFIDGKNIKTLNYKVQ